MMVGNNGTAEERQRAADAPQYVGMHVYQFVQEWRRGEPYTARVMAVKAWLDAAGIANEVCVGEGSEGHAALGLHPTRQVPKSPARGDLLVLHRESLPRAAARRLARGFPALLFLGPVTSAEKAEDTDSFVRGTLQVGDVLAAARGGLVMVTHSAAARDRLAGSGLGTCDTEVIPVVSAWEGALRADGDARLATLLDDGLANIFFSCGRLTRGIIEGLLDVFQAYHHLVNAASRLVLWGRIALADLEVLTGEVQGRGLRDSVLLLPSCRLAAKVTCLKRAHLFFAPGGGEEVFPEIASALFASLPVVARADGYLEELLADSGVIFEEDDATVVGELLESLYRDPLLRERVLQGQRARYRELGEAMMRERLLRTLRRLCLDKDQR